MANVLMILPEVVGDEQMLISGLLKDMDDETAQQFANVYRVRRRDPQTWRIAGCVGWTPTTIFVTLMTDQATDGIGGGRNFVLVIR